MKKSVIVAGIVLCSVNLFAAWDFDVETGRVSAGYNDVQVPRDSGTRISLTKDLKVSTKEFVRLRITKDVGRNKYISVLYAPLTVDASGVLGSAINFNGDSFAAGSNISGRYRFDSYRITYYKVFKTENKVNYKLGFTAKIRDAAILLNDGIKDSEKKNTGFVPLLNFGMEYGFSEKTSFIVDGDALAGGPGRAEDVLFAFAAKHSDAVTLRFGYRIVEGGADVLEVYNFALLNYISAGVTVTFK